MTRWAILRSVLAGMTLAGVLAACAGQGTGIAPAPPPASTSNPASSPLPETPLLPYVNDTPQVCYSLAELEALGEGAVARWDTFCFRGDDGSFSVIQQAKAIEAIRLTLNDPTRQVSFQGVTYMPNSPNGDLRTALFRDPRGSDYYVALLANELVEWTPATDGSALSTGTGTNLNPPRSFLTATLNSEIARYLTVTGAPTFNSIRHLSMRPSTSPSSVSPETSTERAWPLNPTLMSAARASPCTACPMAYVMIRGRFIHATAMAATTTAMTTRGMMKRFFIVVSWRGRRQILFSPLRISIPWMLPGRWHRS